ncbi:MAG TPA: hypothetical protein VJT09_07370 [Pyrinomonadaceae bacterium]|nr:hypothetical protein [Pyrinomonadaceae bacterium]
MAKYKKKRARELRHDKFRDTTMGLVDRAAHRMEGKGRNVLYGLGGLLALGLIIWGFTAWRGSKDNAARQALGRAIQVAETPVVATPVPGSTAPSFRTEKERAQKAVEEFKKVADSYSGSTGEYARFFGATNLLKLDRAKGMSELDALTKSGEQEIAILAKFALAQAKEGDSRYEEAAALYSDIAKQNSTIIAPNSANLRLALVYQHLGKQKEASDLLFNMVEKARQAKDKDGKPVPEPASVRKAATELEKIDPARYAQLTPPALPGNLSL